MTPSAASARVRHTLLGALLAAAAVLSMAACAPMSTPDDRAGEWSAPETASDLTFQDVPGERSDTPYATFVVPEGLEPGQPDVDAQERSVEQLFQSPDKGRPFPAVRFVADEAALNSANDESNAQRVVLSTLGGKDVVRQSVQWPGSPDPAVITTWYEETAEYGVIDAIQLMVMRPDGTLVSVGGYAPDGQLETSGVQGSVLSTKLD